MGEQSYKHWHLDASDQGICQLYFDKQGTPVNTFDQTVLEELSVILDAMITCHDYIGLMILSSKQDFSVGADIGQLMQFHDPHLAKLALQQGQQVFSKLAALPIPSVAVIQGHCLGGGLELALACSYRLAEDHATTLLGLPEVKLGIHPGWGGTVRLPRLIGGLAALNMMLTGRIMSARVAAKLGIVDAAIPRRGLLRAAEYYLIQKPPIKQASFLSKLVNYRYIRSSVAYFLRKQCHRKIRADHYPAPFIMLDNWEKVDVQTDVAFVQEIKTDSQLLCSETAHCLGRVFFLQEQLKKLACEDHEFRHVHIIGAGKMGGEIAAWCALQGMQVTLQDLTPALLAPVMARAYQLFNARITEAYLVNQAMDRLILDVQGIGLKHADIIIEAVVEALATKQAIFKMIEHNARPQAILATNTSSILLEEISTALTHPERLVGIHFFNPVAKMKLVEVVHSQQTDKQSLAKAVSFVLSINHLPLIVKSSPGFLINRMLMPYLLESMQLVAEGIPLSTIDQAMVQFGMPMGPITLADTVGLDICLSVIQYMSKHLPVAPPKQLEKLVQEKKWGQKTGEGFYRYDQKGHRIAVTSSDVDKEHTVGAQLYKIISERLLNCLLQEAKRCLDEKIVSNDDLLDAGMVYGTGFAPFRGGLIYYAKSSGLW